MEDPRFAAHMRALMRCECECSSKFDGTASCVCRNVACHSVHSSVRRATHHALLAAHHHLPHPRLRVARKPAHHTVVHRHLGAGEKGTGG